MRPHVKGAVLLMGAVFGVAELLCGSRAGSKTDFRAESR
jgi:hypothetical protein